MMPTIAWTHFYIFLIAPLIILFGRLRATGGVPRRGHRA